MNFPAQQAAAPACTLRSLEHDGHHHRNSRISRDLVLTAVPEARADLDRPALTDQQQLDAAYCNALAAELALRRLLAERSADAADELQGTLSHSEHRLAVRMRARHGCA
jgi:hypothetical protein